MSKKILHLVCNSHLDPVWQWDWDEGASAALATFYAACELLDKYDFIFCHNEVLLYEYIEKYDPELFKRIQNLVDQGKWRIMSGWYIQPDCLVPSGESFIRQITLGREYFQEKFNSRPTTAINFDAFGHSRGIADILANTGYDSYCFCRPMPYHTLLDKEGLPHGPFLWKGYSGKTIKAIRIEDLHIYCSVQGQAKDAIIRKESQYDDLDIMPILWGVGNHGGVSSQKDLEDIMVLQDEKKGEWEIIHSTLEDYFKSVNPTNVYAKQPICFIKSYSSVSAIKQEHDNLENALYLTEKICSIADLEGKYHYDKQVLKDAERVLCQVEFHDVLSGTAIKLGTDSSIRKIHGAIDALKKEFYAAFVSLAKDLKKVTPNDENFVVFNPYPYEYEGLVEAEFLAMHAIEDPKLQYTFRMYDKDNNDVDYQLLKEDSEINMDRRKRFIFKVKLPAFGVTSYGVTLIKVENTKKPLDQNNDIIIKDKYKEVIISRKTGLIDSYKVNGKEYLSGGAFQPVSFQDNEDPWGWWQTSLLHDLKPFKLNNSGKDPYKGLIGTTLIEDGKLVSEVQSVFSQNNSFVVIRYKLYKDNPDIDINIHVVWSEAMRGLKIKIPFINSGKVFAQMAFGKEYYASNGYEYPCNRYVGMEDGDNAFAIFNRSGIHSLSKKGKNLYLTLFNGSVYCAHPAGDIKVVPIIKDKERYVPYIEQGTHDYSFRLSFNKISELEKKSNEFNQKAYAVEFFPHGSGNEVKETITLSNKDIIISALKRRNDGSFLIRLYNGSKSKSDCELNVKGITKRLTFSKYQFITLVFRDNKLLIEKDSSIY